MRTEAVSWDDLAKRLAKVDGVVSVYAVSGDADIMLELVASDMNHFSEVVLRKINAIKGVAATRSSFVLTEVKSLY